jgi:small-conductance mechanosensitive channel
MEQSTLTWGLVLILVVPALTISLGELIDRFKQQTNPFQGVVQNLRTFVLPSLATLLLLQQLLRLDQSNTGLRVVETLFGAAVIFTTVSVLNVLLTPHSSRKRWQIYVPNLLFQSARAFVILGIAAYLSTSVWQVDLSQVVTALGVGSVVIALALQDTLSNLVSGFLLIFEAPFQVGDWVQIQGLEGEVIEINWRAVRLKTIDRDIVIIPNGVLGQETICNYTLLDDLHACRVRITVSNSEPPNKVLKVLKQTILAVEGVVPEPEPLVRPVNFTDFIGEYEIKYFIRDYVEAEKIEGQFLTNLFYAAQRNNISDPMPVQKHYLLSRKDLYPEADVQEAVTLLRSHPSFRLLDPNTIEQVAQAATIKSYGKGECIVEAGSFDPGFQLILEGTVTLTVINDQGQAQPMGRLTQGNFFGEMVFLRGEPSLVTATAEGDVSTLLVPSTFISDLAQRNPKFAREMNQFIQDRKKAVLLSQKLIITPAKGIAA